MPKSEEGDYYSNCQIKEGKDSITIRCKKKQPAEKIQVRKELEEDWNLISKMEEEKLKIENEEKPKFWQKIKNFFTIDKNHMFPQLNYDSEKNLENGQ